MTINQSLSVLFVNMYNDFKDKGTTYIPCSTVARITMIGLYNSFVKDGSMKPIEEIPIEEKRKLTDECRQVKDHNYTNESLIDTAKILHLIKTINTYT